MSIVSSVRAFTGPIQKNGRRWVRETHTDNVAIPHFADYEAAAGANYDAIMTARAPVIAAQLVDEEIASWIARDDGVVIVLVYGTKAGFASVFRQAYKNSTRIETARLAKWILDHIDNGDFTALQVQNAFGLTAAQWTTLQTKMTNLRTNYNAAIAAVGE